MAEIVVCNAWNHCYNNGSEAKENLVFVLPEVFPLNA